MPPKIAPEVPVDDLPFVRRHKIADYAGPGYFADDGMSYEEIAATLAAEEGGKPLSGGRIRQIERSALMKLRRLLKARGINFPSDALPD